MAFLSLVEIVAVIVGVGLAFLISVSPRFGAASWSLTLFLVPGVLASACLALTPLVAGWTASHFAALTLACLIFCSAGGCLASYTISREDYLGELRKHRWSLGAIVAAAPVLTILLFLLPTEPAPGPSSLASAAAVGSYNHYSALYLLLTSVIALATIEQTFRSAEEHVRWEIKFLLLGIASSFAAILYIASTVLPYPAQDAALSTESLHIFPVIFLLSCCLIFQSWSRSTGHSRIGVSQGLIYSTITLVSVGGYLIMAGLAARWASQLGRTGVPAEPFIFIVSVAMLLTVLTGTAFRHRAKRWIRRNLFAGRFDYRRFWMEASEHVRSVDSTSVPAEGLAKLIESALGALDISVWLRVPNTEDLRLVAVRGTIGDQLPAEIPDLVKKFQGIAEPVSVSEIENRLHAWPADLLRRSKASVVVPLVSAKRLVGFITIGSDRSGKPFDWEAREFLRVLAVHFASEFHKAELMSRAVESREAEAFQTFSTFLLHDLKNFASTLSLIANNAGRHQANPAFQVDAFQSIVDISEKMKKLCNSLRTFSTTLAGNKGLYDLNEILRSVSASFESSVGRTLQLDLGTVPPVVVDREEIVRMLQNLVLNAHEASREGGVIRVASNLIDRSAVISVADEGKGIPEQFFKQGLFQPFHTTKADGLGIGLFHSKKIIEAHSGRIEVTSKEGKGTIVRVILPIAGDFALQEPTLDSNSVPVEARVPEYS